MKAMRSRPAPTAWWPSCSSTERHFELQPDARLVLDQFVCGVENRANSAVLRVIKGMFSFFAGKMATVGRLVIDTPAAQVRSTAPGAGMGSVALAVFTFGIIGELKAESGDVVLLDGSTINYKDLKHGVFEIVTKGDHPQVIVVDDPATTIILRLRGSGVSVQEVINSPLEMARLQGAYTNTLDTFHKGQDDPFFKKWQPADANPGTTGSSGSSSPFIQASFNPSVLPSVVPPSVIFPNLLNPGNTGNTGGSASSNGPNLPTPVAHWQYNSSGNWDNALSWSDAWDPAQVPFAQFLIINQGSPSAPITVTLNSGGNDAAAGFGIGPYSTLNVTDGSLTVLGVADVYGLMKANSTSIDPTLTFNGPVTIFGSGEIEALGSSAKIYFSDATPPAAGTYTVDNFGAIAANGDGAVWFEQATTKNESGGIILAAGNGTVTFDQGSLDNAGTVSAGASNVANGAISFEQVTFTNESGAWVIAQNGGSITFDQATATLTNEAGGTLEAANGGTLTIDSLGNVIDRISAPCIAEWRHGGARRRCDRQWRQDRAEFGGFSDHAADRQRMSLEGGNGSSAGPGQVVLSDFSKNSVVSDGSMAVLTNVDNTHFRRRHDRRSAEAAALSRWSAHNMASSTRTRRTPWSSTTIGPATNNFALMRSSMPGSSKPPARAT